MKRLAGLAEVTDVQLTETRLGLYLDALADLPFEPLRCALEGMIKTARFFPRIPEIREAVLGSAADRADVELAAGESAWRRVLAFVSCWHPDVGPFHDAPTLHEREIQAMRHIGGVYRLWAEQDGGPGLPFLRKDFMSAWRNLRGSHLDAEATLLTDGAILKLLQVPKGARTMWKIRNLSDFERRLRTAVRRRDLNNDFPIQALAGFRLLGIQGGLAVVSLPGGVKQHVMEFVLLQALDDCGESARGIRFY